MCIQTIKSVGVKEYASELWTSIKEIDGGKILSSASELLEVNTAFAIRDKLYLVKDFCQWPVNYIQGLIG